MDIYKLAKQQGVTDRRLVDELYAEAQKTTLLLLGKLDPKLLKLTFEDLLGRKGRRKESLLSDYKCNKLSLEEYLIELKKI